MKSVLTRIDSSQLDRLRKIKDKTGVSIAWQISQAVHEWLKKKDA